MTDLVRLSYAELGARLGITANGARMRARRRRWPSIRGNDGVVRITVSEAELVARWSHVRPVDHPHVRPHNGHDPAQWTALIERAARAEGERDAMKGTITTLETALADLAARLDRAEARLALPWWRRLLLG